MHRARTPASTRIDSRGELGRTLARHSRSPRGRSDAASVPPSEVELFPRAPSKGGGYHEFRDGGVLDAHTGQVRDRDFRFRSPASLQPRGDLAELGIDIPGAQDPGLDRMMNLSEQDALVESVRDDLVRVLQHADIKLLFVRAVGPDGRDVSPRETHSARTSGSRDGVTVITTSEPRTACSTVFAGSTRMPWSLSMSCAKRVAFASDRPNAITRSGLRTPRRAPS